MRVLASPELLDQRTKILDDFVSLLGQNRAMRFAYVEEVTRGKDLQLLRERVEDVLVSWGSLWRDVLVRTSGAVSTTQNPDRVDDIERLASMLNPDQVFHALQKTMESIDAIHRFGNIRMVLETLMLDLPTLSL